VLSGPDGSYLYAYCDEGDLSASERLAFKCEKPGLLRLHCRSRPKAVTLTEVTPHGTKELTELRWSSSQNYIEVHIQPTQQSYWVVARW